MNEIIKITKQELNGEVVETSDARELYEKLKSNLRFNDWVKRRIKNRRFKEGKDFYSFLSKTPRGRSRIDYALITNTAENIALMEDNEIGDNVRQYYIDHRRESEKFINRLMIELQCKNKFLTEDVSKERTLRSRAVRQADSSQKRLRQLMIDTRIKESELRIDSPNKDGNLFNRVIPTYAKHDPKLNGGKVKKLDDNQPYLPSLAFKPKAQGE